MNRSVFLYANCLALATQAHAQSQATMTKQDALAKAGKFYTAYRAKTTPSSLAKKPAPRAVADAAFEAPAYLASEPYWKVLQPDQTEIHLQDRTGAPIRLIDNANESEVIQRVIDTQRRGFAAGKDTDLVPLPAKTLLRNAQAIKAIFPGADEFSGEPQIVSSFEKRPEAQSMFIWPRTAHGIPYQDQALSVTIDAYSGRLKMAGIRNWTPAPRNGTERVSQAEARRIAQEKTREKFGAAAPILAVAKRVIEKNGFWSQGGEARDLSGSYIAWVVTLGLSDTPMRRLIVGVDSQTGEVLSGALEGTRGPGRMRGRGSVGAAPARNMGP